MRPADRQFGVQLLAPEGDHARRARASIEFARLTNSRLLLRPATTEVLRSGVLSPWLLLPSPALSPAGR
jgi:hypothetical protein